MAALIAGCSLALLATACGGAPATHVARLGSAGTTTIQADAGNAAGKYAAALAYSRCVRSHGIAGFPDPQQVGDGIEISGSVPGINRQSPIFVSAQQSCRHLLPHGGQPTRAEQQRELARLLHVSECLRADGISGVPDPTLTAPNDRAGDSDITSNDGVWLEIPNSVDVRSPTFRQAATACNLEMPPKS